MPLHHYGVLKGRPLDHHRENDDDSPHYQIHLDAGGTGFRVPVNVKSSLAPSELVFHEAAVFIHPLTERLAQLAPGFHALPSRAGSGAVDYIRGNPFDLEKVIALPHDRPGLDNDLGDLLESQLRRALADPRAMIYALGERWGPESQRDKVFGFAPGNGVHDIHMNQGNAARFVRDDGVWQDGALLIHHPDENRWSALFLAFQSQALHTDDASGHALPGSRRFADVVAEGGFGWCMSSSELHTLQRAFAGAGDKWSTFIIWAKHTFTLGRADYQRQYEPCCMAGKRAATTIGAGPATRATSGSSTTGQHDLHPTMKPVALVQRAIRNSKEPRPCARSVRRVGLDPDRL
jgi:uncharacterized protein YukJ